VNREKATLNAKSYVWVCLKSQSCRYIAIYYLNRVNYIVHRNAHGDIIID